MQIHSEDAPIPSRSLARLLRWMRLAPGTPEALEAVGLWAEAEALARPATWSTHLAREDFLIRFHPHAQSSAHLMRILEGCPRVWLLAATIGPALETRSAGYFASGRPFAGYVLDRMGTFLVEQAMRDLVRRCGSGATRRYSPGYKDFALEAQAALLQVAGEAFAQVRLTGGYMLTPSKSITAVAGERPGGQADARETARRR